MTTPIVWFLKTLPKPGKGSSGSAGTGPSPRIRAIPWVAAFLLAAVAWHPAWAGKPDKGGIYEDVMHPRILKKLDLSEDQKKKFNEYRESHEKQRLQLREEKIAAELELTKVMAAYPVQSANLLAQGDKITAIQAQMARARLEGLGFFLQNLTQEQHAKFVEMHKKMREKHKEEMRKYEKKMEREREREK